jgi:hypothetical protein
MMRSLLLSFVSTAAGYFAARLADELLGLEALARDIAAWLRAAVPIPTYGGASA